MSFRVGLINHGGCILIFFSNEAEAFYLSEISISQGIKNKN